jgi:hypothetical protein
MDSGGHLLHEIRRSKMARVRFLLVVSCVLGYPLSPDSGQLSASWQEAGEILILDEGDPCEFCWPDPVFVQPDARSVPPEVDSAREALERLRMAVEEYLAQERMQEETNAEN